MYKFKCFVDKYYKVISILSTIYIIILFFVPNNWYCDEVSVLFSSAPFNSVRAAIQYYDTKTIFDIASSFVLLALFIVCLGVSIAKCCLSSKKHIMAIIQIVCFSLIILYFLIISYTITPHLYLQQRGMKIVPNFWNLLYFFFLIFQLTYAISSAYYSKHGEPIPKQPKPRKLSDKERIAELERQVEELKANEKDRSN